MSRNETLNVSPTGGTKAGNLERYDLIPAEPLRKLAIQAGQRGLGSRGSFAQLHDHLWRWWAGEDSDPLTEYEHLTAVAWHAFRLVEENVMPPAPWPHDNSEGRTHARYDRIPSEPLRMLAEHYGRGALKYADDNWRRGYDWRLSFAALNRHLWQWWAGEPIDAETGSPHLIAVAWHAFTLAEFMDIHPEFDTRLITLDHRAARPPQRVMLGITHN
jgi:hypothetical protein